MRTPQIEAAMDEYLDDNCTYTLAAMRDMVLWDLGVSLGTQTIINKLIGKLYTLKQLRVEPMTCNNDVN
ncbi:hypothetical protein PC129_g17950 [Phytophthora cactorum]|uniref:Uncharacterized protein n=2 Tax=Phytophthora cactorum TaxID=29920 RepID=A0A8T1HFI4_9STRA|nr:hypothetical protein Pcac1_g1424 [Phytophthora cactorum]KAG2806735.1 hypothetical protein PC111_g17237 [Phytophthora cactorum]KAG2886095.1 hypothetical protein PC114_g19454 [Phytophthora cactorum]KAG2918471.1 hypothetical protein PC117_g17072 [Phytophthora cactorum]KAG2991510.1 hypothetical protein PC119_g18882 [Phytophthora cactorum]